MTVFGGTGIDQVIELVTESGVYSYVVASYVPELSLFGIAGRSAAGIDHLGPRDHPRDRVLRHLVGFRQPRDRHDPPPAGKINAPVSQRCVLGALSRASSRRCC